MTIKKKRSLYTIQIILLLLFVYITMFLPQQITLNSHPFKKMIDIWVKKEEYNLVHKNMNGMKGDFLLLEYGSNNGGYYCYYFVDFQSKTIKWKTFQKDYLNGEIKIVDAIFYQKINNEFRNFNHANMIYDSTVNILDGTVYFITYQNKNQIITFGTYSLMFSTEQYLLNFTLRNICRKNKQTIRSLIQLFDHTIKENLKS